MFRRIIPILLAGLAAANFAWGQIPGELNPYLRNPAPTIASLMSQVTSDRVVMDRYMRHFAMTREEVVTYFSTLRLARLNAEGVYTMYNVPQSGEVRKGVFNLKKGTKIWIDLVGRPVLKESCGNPLTLGPKRRTSKPGVASGGGAGTEGLEEMAPENESADAYAMVEPMMPGLPANFEMEMPSALDMVGEAPNIVTRPGFDGGWLAIPGILFGIRPGGNGGPPPPGPPPGGPPPPVPEPGTVTALASGLAFLARRRRLATQNGHLGRRLSIQADAPAVHHRDDVLDSDAETACVVNARLDTEAIPISECYRGAGHDVGLLVHAAPNAVPGSMHEQIPKALRFDDGAARPIHRPTHRTDDRGLSARGLGSIDNAIPS